MLPAVDFNDYAALMAGKVCKVRTYRGLTPKMSLSNCYVTKKSPQLSLGICHFAT